MLKRQHISKEFDDQREVDKGESVEDQIENEEMYCIGYYNLKSKKKNDDKYYIFLIMKHINKSNSNSNRLRNKERYYSIILDRNSILLISPFYSHLITLKLFKENFIQTIDIDNEIEDYNNQVEHYIVTSINRSYPIDRCLLPQKSSTLTYNSNNFINGYEDDDLKLLQQQFKKVLLDSLYLHFLSSSTKQQQSIYYSTIPIKKITPIFKQQDILKTIYFNQFDIPCLSFTEEIIIVLFNRKNGSINNTIKRRKISYCNLQEEVVGEEEEENNTIRKELFPKKIDKKIFDNIFTFVKESEDNEIFGGTSTLTNNSNSYIDLWRKNLNLGSVKRLICYRTPSISAIGITKNDIEIEYDIRSLLFPGTRILPIFKLKEEILVQFKPYQYNTRNQLQHIYILLSYTKERYDDIVKAIKAKNIDQIPKEAKPLNFIETEEKSWLIYRISFMNNIIPFFRSQCTENIMLSSKMKNKSLTINDKNTIALCLFPYFKQRIRRYVNNITNKLNMSVTTLNLHNIVFMVNQILKGYNEKPSIIIIEKEKEDHLDCIQHFISKNIVVEVVEESRSLKNKDIFKNPNILEIVYHFIEFIEKENNSSKDNIIINKNVLKDIDRIINPSSIEEKEEEEEPTVIKESNLFNNKRKREKKKKKLCLQSVIAIIQDEDIYKKEKEINNFLNKHPIIIHSTIIDTKPLFNINNDNNIEINENFQCIQNRITSAIFESLDKTNSNIPNTYYIPYNGLSYSQHFESIAKACSYSMSQWFFHYSILYPQHCTINTEDFALNFDKIMYDTRNKLDESDKIVNNNNENDLNFKIESTEIIEDELEEWVPNFTQTTTSSLLLLLPLKNIIVNQPKYVPSYIKPLSRATEIESNRMKYIFILRSDLISIQDFYSLLVWIYTSNKKLMRNQQQQQQQQQPLYGMIEKVIFIGSVLPDIDVCGTAFIDAIRTLQPFFDLSGLQWSISKSAPKNEYKYIQKWSYLRCLNEINNFS